MNKRLKRNWKTFYSQVIPICALLFFTQTSQAEKITDNDKLQQLQQQLSSHNIVRGNFIQTRHMQMFDAPLESKGTFLLSTDQGLWWQQASPFLTSLVLTKDKLSQQVGTEPAQVLKVSDNPMVFYFSHVFLSLFQGDTQALQQQFDLKLTSNTNENWILSLTPKSSPLDKVFSQIKVQGDDYIDSIKLNEIRGDYTDISFIHQTHLPENLTDAEKAIFGQ